MTTTSTNKPVTTQKTDAPSSNWRQYFAMQNPYKNREIWRIDKVTRITGLPRSSVYALAAKGQFPKPVKLTTRASGWDSFAVQAWVDEKLGVEK